MMNVQGVLTDKVNAWGWPWHGLIRPAANPSQGEIVLPNGQTREHPLTGSTNYRIHVPGTPLTWRTPEQAAEDAAAGRAWWNEAILSGTALYGQDLGGWLYCSPDGTRWIIDLDGAQAKRMGEFGKPPQTKAISVSWPADNGQSTPILDFGEGEAPVLQWPVPLDISSDGRKAILMLYIRDPAYGVRERPMPVGFLLVEVTGGAGTPFAAAVTVLHDRAETLGSASYIDAMTVTPGPSGGLIAATGTVTRELTDRIWAVWFGLDGGLVHCYVDCYEEYQQEYEQSTLGSRRTLHRWRLWVEEIKAAELTLEGLEETASPPTAGTDGTTHFFATLNGAVYRDEILIGSTGPLPKPPPLVSMQLLFPRGAFGTPGMGEAFDIIAYSNNMIGLYVVLTAQTPLPVHRYIGAACPATASAPLLLDESHAAALAFFPDRNKLYGPRPYCAWNPVTHEASALSAGIVGWI